MRFYKIVLQRPDGTQVLPKSLGGYPISTLLPDGTYNPYALKVDLDIIVWPQHEPGSEGAFVKIYGIGLAEIGASFDLNDMAISVYGGMSRGLPLANPAQAGPLAQGKIFQAFGNWIGTEQSLDLIFYASTGFLSEQRNIVLNWQAGMPLATALQQTLAAAFPGVPVTISISPALVVPYVEASYHYSLGELAKLVNRVSKAINPTPGYAGVQINVAGFGIYVSDATQKSPIPVKPIAFQDMIGQPTWIAPETIQVKFAMRGDLGFSQHVSLPPSLVTTQAAAYTRFMDKTTFSGNYRIIGLRHVGSSRQPDAASWVTIAQMTPVRAT